MTCAKCGKPAQRLIGTVAHCEQCAFALVEPFRQKHGVTVIRRPMATRPALHHGVGMFYLECGVCGATWVGPKGDPCQWCDRRYERMQRERKERLLFPSWADPSNYGPKYDELDDVAKSIWRRTRGVYVNDESKDVWMDHLTKAFANGFITAQEFEQALKRVSRIVG